MTQHNTIMKQSSYYAYCSAWVVSYNFQPYMSPSRMILLTSAADSAVRAGIVFG